MMNDEQQTNVNITEPTAANANANAKNIRAVIGDKATMLDCSDEKPRNCAPYFPNRSIDADMLKRYVAAVGSTAQKQNLKYSPVRLILTADASEVQEVEVFVNKHTLWFNRAKERRDAIIPKAVSLLRPRLRGGLCSDHHFSDELTNIEWTISRASQEEYEFSGTLNSQEELEEFLEAFLDDAPHQVVPYPIWSAPLPHDSPFRTTRPEISSPEQHVAIFVRNAIHFPEVHTEDDMSYVVLDTDDPENLREEWGKVVNGMMCWKTTTLPSPILNLE